jgi:hypothetical protein
MHNDSPPEAEARHQEFLRSAISHRSVWALRNERGWANWRDNPGEETILPLWTDREAAIACGLEQFLGYHPEIIGLESLLLDWLPILKSRGIWVGTNLTPQMTGIDIPAEELRKYLELKLTEPHAVPNAGPSTEVGRSEAAAGPPSVS